MAWPAACGCRRSPPRGTSRARWRRLIDARRSRAPAQQRPAGRGRVLAGAAPRHADRADALRHRDLALPRRSRCLDLFTRMYRGASHVTFYSRGLHDRALELGLARPGAVGGLSAGRRALRAGHRRRARRRMRARLGVTPPASARQRQTPASARRPALSDRRDAARPAPASRHRARDLRHRRAPRRARGAGTRRGRRGARHARGAWSTTTSSPTTTARPTCSSCRRCSRRCPPSPSRRWRAARRWSAPTIPAASSCTRCSARMCASCPREDSVALADALVERARHRRPRVRPDVGGHPRPRVPARRRPIAATMRSIAQLSRRRRRTPLVTRPSPRTRPQADPCKPFGRAPRLLLRGLTKSLSSILLRAPVPQPGPFFRSRARPPVGSRVVRFATAMPGYPTPQPGVFAAVLRLVGSMSSSSDEGQSTDDPVPSRRHAPPVPRRPPETISPAPPASSASRR